MAILPRRQSPAFFEGVGCIANSSSAGYWLDSILQECAYRTALPQQEVLRFMRQGAGTHYDPFLLAHFFAQLSEICRIAQHNPDELFEEEKIEQSPAPVWSLPSGLGSMTNVMPPLSS